MSSFEAAEVYRMMALKNKHQSFSMVCLTLVDVARKRNIFAFLFKQQKLNFY